MSAYRHIDRNSMKKAVALLLPVLCLLVFFLASAPTAHAASYVTGSYVHTTGTSGALGAAVQSGDVIFVLAWDISGRHATASDGSGSYVEQQWGSDATPAITLTILSRVVTTTETPTITVANSSWFDAFAIRGLANGTKNAGGYRTGDFATNPVALLSTSPTSVSTLVIGYVNSSDNWTGWYDGGSSPSIVNLGHSSAQVNATGYALDQAVGAYTPGITVSGGSFRTTVVGAYFANASAPVVIAPSRVMRLFEGLRIHIVGSRLIIR